MALERERKLVQVPDVVGLPLRKAILLMTQAGLAIDAVLYKESYEERDTVLEQKPPRRQMVYAGSPAVLGVSRESYIKWLPALYQRSDVTGKNFVRDLMWIVQHLFGSIEERLEIIHTFFDPYETPDEFLPWLAGWSAMVLEADWSAVHKRKLIRKAMELYRLRGTVKGLSLFISLFTGFEPMLRENEWPFDGFRIGATSAIGIDSVILPPVDKSRAFVCVMPHRFRDLTAQSIIRLLEIIELEKPAHTTYMLKFEEPPVNVEGREFFQIGVRSGINVGDEVVSPLPVSEETGEPDYPIEKVEPQAPPDPSVYELFATRKRELPALKNVPRADNAPVEGKEITSTKAGFEGVLEFRLEDIMQELLKGEGGGEGGGEPGAGGGEPGDGAGGGGPGAGGGQGAGGASAEGGDVPLAGKMNLDYGAGSLSGAKAPRIVIERETPDDATDAVPAVSAEAEPAAPQAPPKPTRPPRRSSKATPKPETKADVKADADAEPATDEVKAEAEDPAVSMQIDYGHVKAQGQRPIIDVEIEREPADGQDGGDAEGPASPPAGEAGNDKGPGPGKPQGE